MTCRDKGEIQQGTLVPSNWSRLDKDELIGGSKMIKVAKWEVGTERSNTCLIEAISFFQAGQQ
jgi:hypothetical protein